MTRFFCLALVCLATVFFGAMAPSACAQDKIAESVVKIYTVSNRYNHHEPWQKRGQTSGQGSGVIISGNRILTNAHVVSDATFIQVRRAGKVKKVTATITAIAHECDLAILTVADAGFFTGSRPLPLGTLPHLSDKVSIYGFPEGGDKISISQGVVTRVEHIEYFHSNAYLLACQIDAPVNRGASGGPVLMDGRIVGIAFQFLSGQNIEGTGYMIPAPVVRHFLQDLQDGVYQGIPALGLSMQKLENQDMRRQYELADDDFGVLVNRVYPESPAKGKIRKNDVVLAIDTVPIGSDGTIEFRPGQRTYFGYIVQQKQMGERVRLKISRDGRFLEQELILTQKIDAERLVPHQQYDMAPTYFVVAGLVFEPLTRNYLTEYGSGLQWYSNAPTELLHLYVNGEPEEDRRQVVLLVKVLADEVNVGYHSFEDTVIAKVNGKKISTIQDLVRAFEQETGSFHLIEDVRGFRIILDRKKAADSAKRIMRKYAVPLDRSPDLVQ